MTQNSDNERLQVKLYILNDEGNWDDRGPGFLSLYCIEDSNEGPNTYKITITDQNDDLILLESELNPKNNYRRQENTLLTWEEDGKELAISFKEESQCDIAYDIINKTLGLIKLVDPGANEEIHEEGDSSAGVQTSTEFNCSKFENIEESFPAFDYEHLSDIAVFFSDAASSLIKRNQLAEIIESRNLIPLIMKQFHICEDLNDIPGLHNLYNIVKGIFTFTKFSIYETILSDENILDIIGILEYNPVLSEHIEHRKFIKNAVYNELIPYSNKSIRDLIIHTYRLQYIQDALLPAPTLFDERGSVLTSFIFFRKNEIVEAILSDEMFLDEFFTALVNDEIDDPTRRKLAAFFAELTNISRLLQNEKREIFLSKLVKYDVISITLRLLNLNDEKIKISLIEVLTRVVENHPTLLRQALATSPEKNSSLYLILCDEFSKHPESNSSLQSMQIIKAVLDTSNMTKESFGKTQSSEFLTAFYSYCINHVMSPLFIYTSGNSLSDENYTKALSIENIIEIFIICLEFHSSHIKNYVIRSDILKSIIKLLESKHAFLAHAAVRVVRRTINIADDFYNRYLIRENILDYLIVALKGKYKKYDIVNSAILEVFEFIKTVDARIFIVPLVERHREFFQASKYSIIFEKLLTSYETIINDKIQLRTPRFGRISNRYRPFESRDKYDDNSWIEAEDAKDPEPLILENEDNSNSEDIEEPLNVNSISNPEEDTTDSNNDVNFPPIKSKKENDDDFISLNAFRPIASTPSIKINFKRNIAPIAESDLVTTPHPLPVNQSARLVDYPDDEEDCNLPPCEDYVIEDIQDAEIPSVKRAKTIDSL